MKFPSGFQRTKLACYTAYFTMSVIFCLPPLLFVTFRDMYGISYTRLGTLVLVNFCTQLGVDLIFTVFSRHFNVQKVVRIMPCITTLGLLLYALIPTYFPGLAYPGLVLGTVLFSVSAGLSEVLLSPVIAAIPSDTPEKDMSFLHSLYAFGVFFMVVVSTLFLRLFGRENWMWLTVLLSLPPLLSALLFALSPMPDMRPESGNHQKHTGGRKRIIGLALCTLCIFLGSCAENVMSNWISGYMENALKIDKALGDMLGTAMFAILLGMARLTYAKKGGSILKVLFIGMAGAALCYLAAALSLSVPVALAACILSGLFVAMLWPGTLIMMEENVPGVGVAAYALMASGGDLGASVAPQWMGIIIDKVSVSAFAQELGAKLALSPEQIGMKAGMLTTSLFPILGAALLLFLMRYFKKAHQA